MFNDWLYIMIKFHPRGICIIENQTLNEPVNICKVHLWMIAIMHPKLIPFTNITQI